MDSGFITLHRKFLDWEWYDDIKTKTLFLHCLFKANYKQKNWRGNTIERGSFLTSYQTLADETGLSVQNVRTSISKLKSTGELTSKSTSKLTRITLCNYARYQDLNISTNKQLTGKITSDQQATNKPLTTTNKDNNINKETIDTCLTFERFWEMYGKKGNRKTSEARFNKVSEANRVLIAKNLKAYITSTPDKQFRKDAQSWLNMECWNDEVMITQLTPNGEPEFKMLTNEDLRR